MERRLSRNLDSLDVSILTGLTTYGPRNMTKIARKLGINTELVCSRMKRLSSLFSLSLHVNVYHTNLGLKKAIVFLEATPGYEDLLFECLEIKGFCIYLTRCYGSIEGYFAFYAIPVGHETEFKQFLEEVEKLGLAKNIQVSWSTCFHTVNPTGKWFDSRTRTWVFPWDEWVKEIPTKRTELPYTLLDPEDWSVKADEIDIFILGELEKDATISLTDIAKKLGTSLQRVRYHYQKHVIGLGLIEDFQIFFSPFNREVSDLFVFVFEFDENEKMAKFTSSLIDKPFVYSVGKILGESAIIAQIYLPRVEFRRFIDVLSKLSRTNILRDYRYVIQDTRPGKWFREEMHHELFKDGSWIYNHKTHIQNLRNLVELKKGGA